MRLPLVSMGRSASVPSIDPDNETGAMAAIQHLISRGCRQIGMIGGPGRNPCAVRWRRNRGSRRSDLAPGRTAKADGSGRHQAHNLSQTWSGIIDLAESDDVEAATGPRCARH